MTEHRAFASGDDVVNDEADRGEEAADLERRYWDTLAEADELTGSARRHAVHRSRKLHMRWRESRRTRRDPDA